MKMKKYKLRNLLDVKRGTSLVGEYFATSGKYVRLTCGNFDYKNNFFKENLSKSNLFYIGEVRKEFILKEGDIITPLTEQAIGLLGSTAIIPEDDKYVQSQDIAKIECKENMLFPMYSFYLISSDIVKKQLSAAAQQTKIRHTSPDKIKDCVVWIPDYNEQKLIATVLSALDNKIALNRRINTKLEQMAKRLYDYWFVQFDFPNAEGKPYKSSGGKMVYNATLKREIPEGWEVQPLDSFISAFNSGDWGADEPSDSQSLEVRCIRGADINTLANLPKRFIKNANTYKLLSNWNLVIEKSGGSPTQSTARSAFITPGVLERNGGNVVCSNFCEAFSFVDFQASAFFYYTWKMFYDNGIMFNYEGKTSGIRNFMTDTFLANLWIVPPQNLIESFFAKAKTIHAKIDANISESIKLTALRDKLLPLLMNGQVTVK